MHAQFESMESMVLPCVIQPLAAIGPVGDRRGARGTRPDSYGLQDVGRRGDADEGLTVWATAWGTRAAHRGGALEVHSRHASRVTEISLHRVAKVHSRSLKTERDFEDSTSLAPLAPGLSAKFAHGRTNSGSEDQA